MTRSVPAITRTKIEYLGRHLDVVDEKVGQLLQFQALVVTAISIGLGAVWFNYRHEIEKLHHPGLKCVVIGIFWLAFVSWFIAMLLSFWAIRRVAWGDFENYYTKPLRAIQPHIYFLTDEVIKRTAKYRVAVPLTVISVVLLSVCLPFLFSSLMWDSLHPVEVLVALAVAGVFFRLLRKPNKAFKISTEISTISEKITDMVSKLEQDCEEARLDPSKTLDQLATDRGFWLGKRRRVLAKFEIRAKALCEEIAVLFDDVVTISNISRAEELTASCRGEVLEAKKALLGNTDDHLPIGLILGNLRGAAEKIRAKVRDINNKEKMG